MMDKNVKRWLFLFLKKDGEENRLSFLKKFVFFLDMSGVNLFEVSERVFLYGQIDHKFGERTIDTGLNDIPIEKIEKVDRRIKVSTVDGYVYYFYENSAHVLMKSLLDDVRNSRMNKRTDCYLPPAFSREKYF